MQKYIRLILLVVLSNVTSGLSAQTTILDQSMLTPGSFNSFTGFSITGSQTWHPSSQYGAVCSGYVSGQSFENEDWLVSPAMNLAETNNVMLTFSHTRGPSPLINVGVAEGWYTVFATADFTGDPTTTQWIELTGINQDIPSGWQYVSSGAFAIPEAAKSENSRIAFHYVSSATQSATWEIKNVKVTGDAQPVNPNAAVFKITNWNTEWLGCTQFGPSDETLQVNNVVAAMLAMNSDIYCIQEVSNSITNPSIATLISLLGSDQWDGTIVPSGSDCDQRQGIIYKKSRVQLVSSTLLSSGNASQGNSYTYNWAGGRFPALYNVNLVAGTTLIPIALVNIHAKAEDGNAESYTRRLGASEALKTILDGANYNSENLMVIGDFNDYAIGTSSNSCGCTDSPYKNFIDDAANYSCITQTITDWNTSFGIHPLIENIIISNELSANYIANSAAQETAVVDNIQNYFNTTSDHLPVSATFEFSVLGTSEYAQKQSSWSIHPNPAGSELKFDAAGLENNFTTEVFDLLGRQMRCKKINPNTIDVGCLPSGIYILKAGDRFGRFVKE